MRVPQQGSAEDLPVPPHRKRPMPPQPPPPHPSAALPDPGCISTFITYTLSGTRASPTWSVPDYEQIICSCDYVVRSIAVEGMSRCDHLPATHVILQRGPTGTLLVLDGGPEFCSYMLRSEDPPGGKPDRRERALAATPGSLCVVPFSSCAVVGLNSYVCNRSQGVLTVTWLKKTAYITITVYGSIGGRPAETEEKAIGRAGIAGPAESPSGGGAENEDDADGQSERGRAAGDAFESPSRAHGLGGRRLPPRGTSPDRGPPQYQPPQAPFPLPGEEALCCQDLITLDPLEGFGFTAFPSAQTCAAARPRGIATADGNPSDGNERVAAAPSAEGRETPKSDDESRRGAAASEQSDESAAPRRDGEIRWDDVLASCGGRGREAAGEDGEDAETIDFLSEVIRQADLEAVVNAYCDMGRGAADLEETSRALSDAVTCSAEAFETAAAEESQGSRYAGLVPVPETMIEPHESDLGGPSQGKSPNSAAAGDGRASPEGRPANGQDCDGRGESSGTSASERAESGADGRDEDVGEDDEGDEFDFGPPGDNKEGDGRKSGPCAAGGSDHGDPDDSGMDVDEMTL